MENFQLKSMQLNSNGQEKMDDDSIFLVLDNDKLEKKIRVTAIPDERH